MSKQNKFYNSEGRCLKIKTQNIRAAREVAGKHGFFRRESVQGREYYKLFVLARIHLSETQKEEIPVTIEEFMEAQKRRARDLNTQMEKGLAAMNDPVIPLPERAILDINGNPIRSD